MLYTAVRKNDVFKANLFLLTLFLATFAVGCAEIQPLEAPGEVLKHPFGTDPIHIGMTKDEIEGLWGSPDQVNELGTVDQWGTKKEEWVYLARYSKIPIDKGYLYKTKYLYFEGNILISFGDEPQPKTKESPKETQEAVQ